MWDDSFRDHIPPLERDSAQAGEGVCVTISPTSAGFLPTQGPLPVLSFLSPSLPAPLSLFLFLSC